MIKLENVTFRYQPVSAGREASGEFELAIDRLDIAAGEHAAVIGPSGSGKTTLLHLIAGILTPTSGTVRLAEREISSDSDARRRAMRITQIGLVFQEFELLEYLSVVENILLPFRIHPTLKLDAAARRRAVELAEAIGIADTLRRRPGHLSQGERQRVAVCRALVTEPKVLLADEPTGNLDPERTNALLTLLLEQAREHEATLLMVTHDHALLDRFDRVIDLAP